MTRQNSKAQLLKDIHSERGRLEKTLATLSADEMIRPGIVGNWSVKDVLAHLVEWERLFLDWYRCGKEGRSPIIQPVGMSKTVMDRLNAQLYEQNWLRDLENVLADFHASYKETLEAVQEIPEQDMFSSGRFAWTGRLVLADYIAGNSCNHYRWANMQIRKAL